MLRIFKEKKNLEVPLTLTGTSILSSTAAFSGAYGIIEGFYLDNGTIKYGPAEPGYKDYLALLNTWYKERLLDPDFPTQDGKTYTAKMTGSKSGATLNSAVGGIGSWTKTMKAANSNTAFVGAPYPTLKKGDKPKVGQLENQYLGTSSVAISSQCKEKEIAARWLDYGYSKDGLMLFNFGIENVSFEIGSNGYPKYIDSVKNGGEINLYMRTYSGPYIQDKGAYQQMLTLPEQEAAINVWSQPENTAWLPPITSSKEESEKMAGTYTSIKTYVDEMFLKFVMGQEPLSNFDKYAEQVKKMGLKDILDIQTAAYNRYNKR